MKLKNKLEVEETLEVGVLPNAPTNNFSVVFETVGMFQRRQVGNIINKNDTDFLPSVSNSFPTSVFAFNVSTTNANPNLTVSFVNQVAGTVFSAPQSLNGTPAFRMLQDSDLSQTTVFTKIGDLTALTTSNKTDIVGAINEVNGSIPNVTGFVPYTGANQPVNLNTQQLTSGTQFLNNKKSFSISSSHLGGNSNIPGYFKINLTPNAFYGTTFNLTISGSYNANHDYGIVQVSGFLNPSTSDNNQDFIFHTVKGFTGGGVVSNRGFYIEPKQYVDGNGIYYIKAWKRPSHNIYIYVEGNITVADADTNYEPNIAFVADATPVTLYNKPNYITENEVLYPLLSGSYANPTWISSLDWGKIIDAPTIPNAANNGLLTISTSSDLTGGGTFSADQATASNVNIGLSAGTLASLALANTAVQPSALSNYYQSGDVNIPALGGDYVVFPETGSGQLTNFDFNSITTTGFYNRLFNAGSTSTYNAPKTGFYGFVEVSNHGGNLLQTTRPYRVTDGVWMRGRFSGTWTDWVEFIHSGNLASYANTLLTGFVPTSRTITAGNGLSGGGDLTANRTITLGTPSAITLSSTNSVTTSSHTHAFTPGGTTAQYIRGDGSLATMPTFTDAITTISRNGVNIPIVSQNVDIPVFSTSGAGLVPARVGSVATKYLREDGTWVTPANTTYTAGTGISIASNVITNTAPNATHTGDVTGATALTIANSAVTHAKYQNIATQRILGRATAGTGNVEELTDTQVKTILGLPDVIGNGTFTVQGTGYLTGSGSTSANASANTSANLDLTNAAKNDIQKGVSASDYVQTQFEYLDWERFHDASGGGVTIDVNESFNNIVCNTSGGGSPIDITNHNVNGAKLYLQGANHGTQQYVLDYMEKDGSFNTVFQVETQTGVFTWSKELGVWRYLGTML